MGKRAGAKAPVLIIVNIHIFVEKAMNNIQPYLGDCTLMLEQMKTHRNELDDAIKALEKLVRRNRTGGQTLPSPTNIHTNDKGNDYAKMGVYEAVVTILEKENQELSTNDLVQHLKNGGKDAPRNIVATTLYKAVDQKKNCRIARAGKGMWKLVG
jgi:hypothetical protein